MARNVKPLTFTEVNKAKPKEKEYTLSDGQGLMLSIRPSGSKVWLFKYQKPFTKKRTNISFGSFPGISIADARKLKLGHSFRHTFINELKQKHVSKEIVECNVGHLHQSESFDTYSHHYSPAILAPIVNMIDTSHTASVLPYGQKKTTA